MMTKIELNKTLNLLKNPLYLLAIFSICGFLVFLWLVFWQPGLKKSAEDFTHSQVQIQDKEKTLIFNQSGLVEFKTPTNSLQQQWEKDKLDAVLKTLKEEIENSNMDTQATLNLEDSYQVSLLGNQGTLTFKISKDNQVLQQIFQFFENPAGENEEINSDWFSQVLRSPSASGASGGGSSGGNNAANKPSDCPLWILSMCVYPKSWIFSPAPNPSPKTSSSPASSEKPKPTKSPAAPDCTLWNQLITGKTVISNTLCIKEEKGP